MVLFSCFIPLPVLNVSRLKIHLAPISLSIDPMIMRITHYNLRIINSVFPEPFTFFSIKASWSFSSIVFLLAGLLHFFFDALYPTLNAALSSLHFVRGSLISCLKLKDDYYAFLFKGRLYFNFFKDNSQHYLERNYRIVVSDLKGTISPDCCRTGETWQILSRKALLCQGFCRDSWSRGQILSPWLGGYS
jgi:hypothetical protein